MRLRGPAIAAALAVGVIALGWDSQGAFPRSGPSAYLNVRQIAHLASAPRLTPWRVAVWAHGSWCWFADPRAVRVVGLHDRVFVGWLGWRGQVFVGAYDNQTGTRNRYIVGWQFHDDHSSPAILVEPDHRLTVFWSGHNGPVMFYRSSVRPEDVSAWGPIHQIRHQLRGPLGFTYPNPVMLPGEHNRLYLFWRGSDWGQDYAIRSIDGRWSPERRLISRRGERPYVKAVAAGADAIDLAFTNGHPRELTTSVFFARYRAGALWHADGRLIRRLGGAPITPYQADTVYNGRRAGISAWVWDVAQDAAGRPIIVYATFPPSGVHLYWYARWEGRRWRSHLIAPGGPTISPTTIEAQYSGGMALDHQDPSTVILSRKVRGLYELERWQTGDGGAHWRHVTLVRGGTDNLRPVVARGSHGAGTGILWLRGNYGSYTNYHTSIDYLH